MKSLKYGMMKLIITQKNHARKSMLIRFAFGKKTLKLIQEFQKLLKKFHPSLLPQQLLKDCSVLLEKYTVQSDVILVTLNLNNLCLLDQIPIIKKINNYSNGLQKELKRN